MALIEVAKSLVPSNVKGHGEVPYQKPQLKLMAHGVYPHIAQCISALHSANSTWTEYSAHSHDYLTAPQDILGWGENDRGVSYTFGRDIVQDMSEALDVSLICRGHQVSSYRQTLILQ